MPSYHTVMALMVAWALRGTWAFLPGVLFAVLTILATPVFGGHYFVDILAGSALFLLAVAVLHRWRAGHAPAPGKQA